MPSTASVTTSRLWRCDDVPTSAEFYERHRHLFGSVPPQGHMGVCKACLGPLNPGFQLCQSCQRLLDGGAPRDILRRVVPMTSAMNPSEWYRILWRYKSGHAKEGEAMMILCHCYFERHRERLRELLDGEPSVWTIVPSSRVGYSEQPLQRLLGRLPALRAALRQTLRFAPRASVGRSVYSPGSLEATGADLHGQRVVLIEDTWVTGATAVSAAGALRAAGATAVATVAIARVFNKHYWNEGHSYLEAHGAPYDITVWPRTC